MFSKGRENFKRSVFKKNTVHENIEFVKLKYLNSINFSQLLFCTLMRKLFKMVF